MNASVQSHGWDSSGEDGEAAVIADELDGLEGSEVAVKKERIVPKFRVSFAKLAVRMKSTNSRREIQNLMDLRFGVFLD